MTSASIPDRRHPDITSTFAALRRRLPLILLCLLVTTVAATGFSLLQQKEYTASASLLFRDPGFAEELFGSDATSASSDATREAATNVRLVGLDIISLRTAKRLRGELTADQIRGALEVSNDGLSDVATISVTDPDPRRARLIANTFARQFIFFRARADRSKLLRAKRVAERGIERLSGEELAGPRGEALSRAAEKLGILASLQTGNAELVQPADLPNEASSPKPVRNGLLGAVLGLLLGVGLALLFERLNRRLRDPEEAQEAFGLPVLGTVPESKAIMASNEGEAAAELPFMENEAFRMLRASLRYFNVDRDMRSVVVTSHGAEVGKSTVAWNLARVAATSSKVIVVETDLRNPTLARQHGLNMGPGLAELLTQQVDLDGAIQSKPIVAGGNGGADRDRQLDVIVSGMLPPNPAELIESHAMSEALAELRERYELVVLDTAPVGVVSDAFPLLAQVDGTIVVARIGKSTSDSAERLREQLDRLEAPVLGIVANGIKVTRGGKYGYGNYGGYYGRAATEPPAEAATEKPGASA